MDDFKRWLDEEIKNLESVNDENNMFMCGKISEATRIRAMLLMMNKEKENDM